MKEKNSPPKYMLRFFRWFCHPDYLEDIEGDLLERFDHNAKEINYKTAKREFIRDILKLLRPEIIKPVEGTYQLNFYGMFKNYLKISWRNIAKNKVFSLINISGLSLGLTCSILIALWVQNEYQIDNFHEDLDQIYKVTSCEYSGKEVNGSYDTPGRLAEELKKVIPDVELACGYSWISWYTFSVEDKKMKVPGTFAGEDFFKIFSYPFLIGSPEEALKTPESIAISRKMANNFFGSPEQAMGESINFNNETELKISGVFEDITDKSSEKFQYIISWEFFVAQNKWLEKWGNSGPSTFVKLQAESDADQVSKKIQHFIKNYDEGYSDNDRLELGLQPYKDQYLYSNFDNGKIAGGRIEYVKMFEIVAVFILLIACINFMNLSTARSVKRAKEIGVRKVIGAVRISLIGQFIIEALLFTLIAIVLSLVLLFLLLPAFNLLTSKHIVFPATDTSFWLGIFILTLVTGIISGAYPAFLLSSFKPIAVIKNNVKTGKTSGLFRKGLVVFQFALSMIFIVGMIVISKQVDYIKTKNLGYQKNNLVYLPNTGEMARNFDYFKAEALKIPGVEHITRMSSRPMEIDNTTAAVDWEGKDPAERPTFTQATIGYDFIETMQSTMLYGREFSEGFADSASYIINETALKTIGYKDPIGMPLTFWEVKGTIVGVVKDFHFKSLHDPIKPLVLRLTHKRSRGYALIRIESDKMQEALENLEILHEKVNPEFPFAHQFADEEYGYLYRSEQVVARLSRYFAFLAIFISCLGLLGLVIFMAEQRVKEIGIRKVLGAKVTQIIALLSKDFMKLIGIAIVIASPIAYYVMKEWLQGFEYHVKIQWWMFVIAASGAVLIALITISYQSIKTALMNPVKSLRSE
ncbi:ABC transporter permease [Chondrinema litorale]|uniref:ABC transporter permease n=1 Tax=Chondrinema litorale TaxID=2994555 RepID=UPI002542C57C|nr:ABC transporter permease [Chondrinema litorale]UZR97659.1 ABC transporter permease [Chondrinema litorale]